MRKLIIQMGGLQLLGLLKDDIIGLVLGDALNFAAAGGYRLKPELL